MFHEHGDLRDRTREFARRVARAFHALPTRDRVAQEWGRQMLRSGSSVGANYREAQRGRSKAEYRSRLGDCLREVDETVYWIELLELEKYFRTTQVSALKREADELTAIFVTLLK